MYCIDCGTQNLDSTRYCSRCGLNLEGLCAALTQPLTQESTSLIGQRHVGAILAVTALIGIVGFCAVFGSIIALSDILSPRIGGGIVPVILFAGGFGVFGLVMIIRMLLGLLNGAKAAVPTGPLAARLAAPPQQVALPPSAFRQPVPSVVEHTTARLGNYAPPADERER